MKYYKKNLVHNYNIDSDNFYQLPRTTKEHRRIKLVKDILDEENLNRTQLNLIYKEYNLLGQLNQEFISNKSNFDLISGFKTLFEILFFILLLLTPLFFNIYKIISPGIDNINLYGITISSFGFRDLQTLLWVINSKLLMIIPVTLWFFTSRYWWKYFLLIPFSISVFQLIEMFKDSSKMDGEEIYVIFPLVVLITGIMVFLTGRVRRYVMLLEFYYKMEQKINKSILSLSMDKGDERSDLKKELTELIKEHKKYPPEEYLRRLKAIKGRLEELKEQEY
ncbi:hypothetical protein [Robertkochia marina]|uniref:hypothetical protein n=1 Tax=Robertkochia marina TaxID=1227945 RepID=UPI001B3B1FC3|nr:hypothetical protein [Robertkochia marina]